MEISIGHISAMSIGVPALVGTLLIYKLKPTLRILYGFVIITMILEILSFVARAADGNNLYLFHSYVYIEYIVITAIYYRLFDTKLWKVISISFLIVFLVFSAINMGFFEGVWVFNSNQRYVEGIMVIVLCVAYFSQVLRKAEERYLIRQPFFWLNSGFLIYFSGTLILFLVSRDLMMRKQIGYFEIHGVLNILLNIVYATTLLLGRKK